MSDGRPIPSAQQALATDPARSNWVSANAGSGKTHVLTQRVARLLLAGSPPQKILCLTYTKAAASEMQTRLFRLLGEWAMASQDDLAQRLGELTGQAIRVDDPDRISEARRLFARALETPGGLKIQTIHAFCDSLLRRFPLEAGISPRFEVLDDRQSALMLSEIRSEMGQAAEDGQDTAFDHAARRLNEADVTALIKAALANRASLDLNDLEQTIQAWFGDAAGSTLDEMASTALDALDWQQLGSLAGTLSSVGGQVDRALGAALDVSGRDISEAPQQVVQTLIGAILTGKKAPRSTRNFPTRAVRNARPTAEAECADLTDWATQTVEWLNVKEMATRTNDLHLFARGLLTRYQAAKAARGLLDFDDLITKARDLLVDRDMCAWVLYKLDQGIDHILVDEAQDTSPLQWNVIAAIADEFLSGDGARREARSIFVVGDEKQSIYSFQGADPQAFGQMRRHFAERLTALDNPMGQPALIKSYRSAPAILDFVDAVFAEDAAAAAGLSVDGTPVKHEANRPMDQGRVELWPPIEPKDRPEPPEWWRPIDIPAPGDTKQELAGIIANRVRNLIDNGVLPKRDGDDRTAIRPGDILILVTKRDALAQGIIRELKTKGVAVAGADRLSLAGELAVKDLMALLKVSTMPGDDLSLAALLRSPLCGLSEDDLFDIAHDREGTLWQALRGSGQHTDICDFLDDMAGRADFLRPYEFLERALTHYEGRRKLLARLGGEAEDPLDELLGQALSYEMRETPSLVGFIAWIEAGDIKVKREMESGADEVRLMTVHGAKGLEAPIVILPDTMSAQPGRTGQKLLPTVADGNKPELTLWAGARGTDDPVTAAAREAAERRERAERQRLLYVALTRAERWLIICGAQSRRPHSDTWYELISQGMDRLAGVQTRPSPTGTGEMRCFETGPSAGALASPVPPSKPVSATIPDWVSRAPSEKRALRLSPSSLGSGTVERSGEDTRPREIALQHGLAVHKLLEFTVKTADYDEDTAQGLLATHFPGLDQAAVQAVLEEVSRVVTLPAARVLFGNDALAEVNVLIKPRGSEAMIGRIDRLIVGRETVQVIDFKSDAHPPDTVDQVAEGYLAQLGAYCSAIADSFPERQIEPVILWTRTPSLMPISRDLTDAAYDRAISKLTRNA